MLRALTEVKAVALTAKIDVDHPTGDVSRAPLLDASPSNIGDAPNMVIIGNASSCGNCG